MTDEIAEDIYLDSINDEIHHNKYCPMGIAKARGHKSSCCLCLEIAGGMIDPLNYSGDR